MTVKFMQELSATKIGILYWGIISTKTSICWRRCKVVLQG